MLDPGWPPSPFGLLDASQVAWKSVARMKHCHGDVSDVQQNPFDPNMAAVTLQSLGRLVADKRDETGQGLRDAAGEIGVSPATLSRVERGHLPDLESFGKICRWLRVDAGELLGTKSVGAEVPRASVHFRKPSAVPLETARALAEMIITAQRAVRAMASQGVPKKGRGR